MVDGDDCGVSDVPSSSKAVALMVDCGFCVSIPLCVAKNQVVVALTERRRKVRAARRITLKDMVRVVS